MKTIVLLLALASAAFADEYTPVDWLEVTENSGVTNIENGDPKLVVGVFTVGSGCILGVAFTINDATYSIRTTQVAGAPRRGFRMERRAGNARRRSLRPDLGHARRVPVGGGGQC